MDKFREFVEQMARFTIAGDDDETMHERVNDTRDELGLEPDEPCGDGDVIEAADDEFLLRETHAFWDMIRAARELLR
jgi:hypothetical protein